MSEEFPTVASSLLINGTIVSHTNLVGEGQPNVHPAIWKFVGSLPPEQRGSFTGRCAESTLISDQLWKLDAEQGTSTTSLTEAAPYFQSAAIGSRLIRPRGNPDHGKPTTPCPVCATLLAALGVEIIS